MEGKDMSEIGMNIGANGDVQMDAVPESSTDDSLDVSRELNEPEERVEETADASGAEVKEENNETGAVTEDDKPAKTPDESSITEESANDEKEEGIETLKAEIIEKQKLIEEQYKQIEELKNQYNSCIDSLQRLMAEFDNYKKRTAKEKEAIYNNACADVVSEFLPVIDNVELAMNNLNDAGSLDSIKQGVNMVFKQLMDVFGNLGVEEIPALEQAFDPEVHNAVMHIEDENYDENIIVEVFKKGYKLNDKVLRHSMVKVAN